MNILTVAPHGLYQDYSASFVHNQAKVYVQKGHRVRAVIPLAFGKRNDAGKRFGKIVDIHNVDGVELCYVRYLSLSRFGAGGFNKKSARMAVKFLMRKILKDFSADVIDAINHDRKPYVDAVAGRNALEMILAIYKSRQTGLPVKLPLTDFASTDMAGTF